MKATDSGHISSAKSASKALREKQWRELILEWSGSGQTQLEFCHERVIPITKFRWWKAELKRRDTSGTALSGAVDQDAERSAGAAFVPVRIGAGLKDEEEGPRFEIELRGGRILRVRAGFDEETLSRLIDVLEALPCG